MLRPIQRLYPLEIRSSEESSDMKEKFYSGNILIRDTLFKPVIDKFGNVKIRFPTKSEKSPLVEILRLNYHSF
ncbi:hypothetical protein NQ317_003900 [Molorchus minor]|uniref:Uncharacterized protein n=1 Tax=Molorchus minor TaxID=1323400 RepID=A0ABQ9J7H9_9CUCU|nr:hypothetical protein NQ317_003900 [Molorchus minor]